MDADSEQKIVTKLLVMIAEDSSGDVKGMAVKWCVLERSSLLTSQLGSTLHQGF